MKLKYHLFCLITISLFSTLEFVSKKLGGGVSAYTLTAWRFLIGGLVILPFAIRQYRYSNTKLQLGSILQIGALGILNVCISMLLLQLAIHYGKASLSAVVVSGNPIFVSLFAALIIREKLSRIQIIALTAGAVGLLLIVIGEQDFRSGNYLNLPLGILLAFLAAISFGLYTVLTKKSVLRYGNMVTNSVSFIIGSLSLFVIKLIMGQDLLFPMEARYFWGIAYFGIFITGIAYLLYFEGMKGLSAAKASQYFFLKPVIAGLLAYFFLQEVLSSVQVAGIVLIILSISYRTVMDLPGFRRIR